MFVQRERERKVGEREKERMKQRERKREGEFMCLRFLRGANKLKVTTLNENFALPTQTVNLHKCKTKKKEKQNDDKIMFNKLDVCKAIIFLKKKILQCF